MKINLKSLAGKIQKKKNQLATLTQELVLLEAQLQSLCPHTNIEEKSRYIEGTYYDTAHTEYWNVCILCGERSKIFDKNHGYY